MGLLGTPIGMQAGRFPTLVVSTGEKEEERPEWGQGKGSLVVVWTLVMNVERCEEE